MNGNHPLLADQVGRKLSFDDPEAILARHRATKRLSSEWKHNVLLSPIYEKFPHSEPNKAVIVRPKMQPILFNNLSTAPTSGNSSATLESRRNRGKRCSSDTLELTMTVSQAGRARRATSEGLSLPEPTLNPATSHNNTMNTSVADESTNAIVLPPVEFRTSHEGSELSTSTGSQALESSNVNSQEEAKLTQSKATLQPTDPSKETIYDTCANNLDTFLSMECPEPPISVDVEKSSDGDNTSSGTKDRNSCQRLIFHTKKFFKVMFSHIGLLLLVVGYILLGAFIFMKIEENVERGIKLSVNRLRGKLLNDTLRLLSNYQLVLLTRLPRDSVTFIKRPVVTEPTTKPPDVELPRGKFWWWPNGGVPQQLTEEEVRYLKLLERPGTREWNQGVRDDDPIRLPPVYNVEFEEHAEPIFLRPEDTNSTLFDPEFLEQTPRHLNVLTSTERVLPLIENLTEEIKANLTNLMLDYTSHLYNFISQEGWNGQDSPDEVSWGYSGSVLFTISVVTTIGYGHVTPKTIAGKVATIIYAVIGIPLFFSFLSSHGDNMARAFRLLYARGCRPAYKRCLRGSEANDSGVHGPLTMSRSKSASALNMLAESSVKRAASVKNQQRDKNERLRSFFGSPKHTPITTGTTTTTTTNSIAERPVESTSTRQPAALIHSHSANSLMSDSRTVKLAPYPQFIKSKATPGTANSVILKTPIKSGLAKAEDVTVPLWLTVLIMTVYLVIGASLFMYNENEKDFLKWTYFCFVTLSTIGFGDIVPGTSAQSKREKQILIVVAGYVALGLCLFAMCFKLMEEEAKNKIRSIGQRIGLVKRPLKSVKHQSAETTSLASYSNSKSRRLMSPLKTELDFS